MREPEVGGALLDTWARSPHRRLRATLVAGSKEKLTSSRTHPFPPNSARYGSRHAGVGVPVLALGEVLRVNDGYRPQVYSGGSRVFPPNNI